MSGPGDTVLTVDGLGLATSAGPVFADVSFTVPHAGLTVVVGPSGSGRSALLLAVGGRMRGLTGEVRLGRHAAATRPRDLRSVTALARLAGLVRPEPQLTVAESVVERTLIDAVGADEGEAALARAEAVFGVAFARDGLVDRLDAYHRTLFCVALALVRPAQLVLLDDADAGLDLADQRRLLDALGRLADTGVTLLVSTTEADAVPATAHLVRLENRP